jgi:asparagine synthetase B (glutamine-hydrolysing)
MCGIVGFVRTASMHDATKRLIEELLLNNMDRGTDAAGALVLNGTHVRTVKMPGPATDLIKTNGWKHIMGEPTWDMFIGHTRAATHGNEKLNKNNHPHSTDHYEYSLVHNGIISGPTPKELTLKSDCDSEIALRLIERYGIMEGAQKLSNMTSSYAICCIDSVLKKFYVFRGMNPVFYIDASNVFGGMVFSSSRESIRLALAAVGIDWRTWDKWIIPLPAYQLFQMTNQDPVLYKVSSLVEHNYGYNGYNQPSAYQGFEDERWETFWEKRQREAKEKQQKLIELFPPEDLNQKPRSEDGKFKNKKYRVKRAEYQPFDKNMY